jgi:hypothetical protein
VERADKGGREQRLYEIVLGYLEAAERGETADPAELQGSHPEFAAELQGFLESCGWLERLTEPLQRALRAGPGPGATGAQNGPAAP